MAHENHATVIQATDGTTRRGTCKAHGAGILV
jgi:hypothetical protein